MHGRRDAEFTDYLAVRLPALQRVAYLLCRDSHQADDLVQGDHQAVRELGPGPVG